MGVYIKGMEMPDFGERIIILTSSGYVEDVSGNVIQGVEAVSVPPHGCLIDADKYASDWLEFEARHYVIHDKFDEGRVTAWNDVARSLREYVPIIIPAEEG